VPDPKKNNLDYIDKSEAQARVNRNPVSGVQAGQERGMGIGESRK